MGSIEDLELDFVVIRYKKTVTDKYSFIDRCIIVFNYPEILADRYRELLRVIL